MLSFWQIVNKPWNQNEGISIPICIHHYFRLYDLQDDEGEIYLSSIRPLGSFYFSKISDEHAHKHIHQEHSKPSFMKLMKL